MAKTKSAEEITGVTTDTVELAERAMRFMKLKGWLFENLPGAIDSKATNDQIFEFVTGHIQQQIAEIKNKDADITARESDLAARDSELTALRGRSEESEAANASLTKRMNLAEQRLKEASEEYKCLLHLEDPKMTIAEIIRQLCLAIDPTLGTIDINTPLPEGDELWEMCMSMFGIEKPSTKMTSCKTVGDLNAWAGAVLADTMGAVETIRGANSPADKNRALTAVRQLAGFSEGRSAILREAVLSPGTGEAALDDSKVQEALQFCSSMDQNTTKEVEAFLRNK